MTGTPVQHDYNELLSAFAACAGIAYRSDVVCVVVVFRNGFVNTHVAQGKGWTFKERLKLFRNLLGAARIAAMEAKP